MTRAQHESDILSNIMLYMYMFMFLSYFMPIVGAIAQHHGTSASVLCIAKTEKYLIVFLYFCVFMVACIDRIINLIN